MTTTTRGLLTTTEAAERLGGTRGRIHYHRLAGHLPATRDGRRYLIPATAVDALRKQLEPSEPEEADAN